MPPELPEELTLILNSAAKGDAEAADRAWCAVYADLRDVASRTMGAPKIGEHRSPGPTTIVGRAFLNLHADAANGGSNGGWENRKAFFVTIARELVRFLIEHRKAHAANGRGGFARVLPLGLDFDAISSLDAGLVASDAGVFDALTRLESDHLLAAETVWLRYVCGLTIEQTADLLEIKPRTVCKHWNYAKAWIRRELQSELGISLPEAV